jgi:hypothetical protein
MQMSIQPLSPTVALGYKFTKRLGSEEASEVLTSSFSFFRYGQEYKSSCFQYARRRSRIDLNDLACSSCLNEPTDACVDSFFLHQPGKRAPKPIHPVVNAYLIVYNWASFAAWFYVLFQTVNVLLATGNDYTKVYDVVGDHLVWIQTAALLEVLHSLLGFVKSPVGTTAMQVASRLLLVWGICTLIPVPEVQFKLSLHV